MIGNTSTIVNRVYGYCGFLRNDGVSYLQYLEQLTYLLFLKMADERSSILGERDIIPSKYGWKSLIALDGPALEEHYNETLSALGRGTGLIPVIFRKARNEIEDPAKLRRLIGLIDKETWTALDVDVKGEIYEGLLEKGAQDTKTGAGQYFTPRPLIRAIVEVMRPTPDQVICDPACGTGGFLLAAYDFMSSQYGMLDREQQDHLRFDAIRGWELVQMTARLCVMNLYLHGISARDGKSPITVDNSLRSHPAMHFDMVLTNPPFGTHGSDAFVSEQPETRRESQAIVRDDFWTSANNKQMNFVQHTASILAINGKAAVVVPDNVLFEAGAGEVIRRRLLQRCDFHTLLRLPTGIFYKPGVKANVLFFDRKPASETPWTRTLWIYDLRTNQNFTLKERPLARADLDDFVVCYNPANRHERTPTWSAENPAGRWRAYTYGELIARDKVNLDIFWLRDESLEESANLPAPDVIAAEIMEDLEAALEQFREIAADMGAPVATVV